MVLHPTEILPFMQYSTSIIALYSTTMKVQNIMDIAFIKLPCNRLRFNINAMQYSTSGAILDYLPVYDIMLMTTRVENACCILLAANGEQQQAIMEALQHRHIASTDPIAFQCIAIQALRRSTALGIINCNTIPLVQLAAIHCKHKMQYLTYCVVLHCSAVRDVAMDCDVSYHGILHN
ncbi:hypothetical protein M426DRAFT_214072 [Hypoxylon sp. CI-4A]|nr:hypothetical protein M426DRAFT_214072 [Hypoxylon sp. CI-4A]